MDKYVRIAETGDVPKNSMRVFKVSGREMLIANVEDKFYAFENRCPHMGYPLYFGNLEGMMLTCGFHYAKFDVTTGKPLNRITDKSLRTFKLRVQGSKVLVKL